jgi:4-hydroxy-tetrahydrodipicolinate synthase
MNSLTCDINAAAGMPRGSLVHLTTPLGAGGDLDAGLLEELILWHISAGTDGIVVPGTPFETLRLSAAERRAIIETSVRAAGGRIPVMAFCRGGNTAYVMKECASCADLGVSGIFVRTPYRGAGDEEVLRYFAAVAEASPIPIIMNNAPDETGLALRYETARQLRGHDRIAGILESGRDISLTARFGRLADAGFVLYAGNDDAILPMLSLGGAGAVSTLANVLPGQTHNMILSYLRGGEKIAHRMQRRCLDLVGILQAGGGAAVKAAMGCAGVDAGGFRSPLEELSQESLLTLRRVMGEVQAFERQRPSPASTGGGRPLSWLSVAGAIPH